MYELPRAAGRRILPVFTPCRPDQVFTPAAEVNLTPAAEDTQSPWSLANSSTQCPSPQLFMLVFPVLQGFVRPPFRARYPRSCQPTHRLSSRHRPPPPPLFRLQCDAKEKSVLVLRLAPPKQSRKIGSCLRIPWLLTRPTPCKSDGQGPHLAEWIDAYLAHLPRRRSRAVAPGSTNNRH